MMKNLDRAFDKCSDRVRIDTKTEKGNKFEYHKIPEGIRLSQTEIINYITKIATEKVSKNDSKYLNITARCGRIIYTLYLERKND